MVGGGAHGIRIGAAPLGGARGCVWGLDEAGGAAPSGAKVCCFFFRDFLGFGAGGSAMALVAMAAWAAGALAPASSLGMD